MEKQKIIFVLRDITSMRWVEYRKRLCKEEKE